MKPEKRREGLVVRELPDEVLIYDLERHEAHCLNSAAAFVFKQCDGRTTVREIAARLPGALELPADEGLVWMALDRLGKAHLLEGRVAPTDGTRFSRRMLLRRLGIGAAALLPLVSSIVAPTPAEAAASCTNDCTGKTNGTPCTISGFFDDCGFHSCQTSICI